jgi:hypothetical protein
MDEKDFGCLAIEAGAVSRIMAGDWFLLAGTVIFLIPGFSFLYEILRAKEEGAMTNLKRTLYLYLRVRTCPVLFSVKRRPAG